MYHARKRIRGLKMELRDCPFCGGQPEWIEVPGNDCIMRCSVCHASTRKARWTPKEAAADWNAGEIDDDHFAITEDRRIDEYLTTGIRNVLFGEYLSTDSYPAVDGGFLCRSAVVVTETIMLCIDAENAHLRYDDISGYGSDYYRKQLSTNNTGISFEKSRWRKDSLLSVSFCCEGRKVKIAALAERGCLIVREE